MKGELHPSKNLSEDGLRHLVFIFLLTDDSANDFLVIWRGYSGDSNVYYYVTASRVDYHIKNMKCDHSPCEELGFSTPHNMNDLITTLKIKMVPRLSSSRSGGHVIESRCQPTPTATCFYI